MNAIEVNNVSKRYGRVQALSDVSFSVGKSEVFGLIGPDGAGKTSMYRILCTLLLPDEGTATVDGFDVVRQMTEIPMTDARIIIRKFLTISFTALCAS